MNEPDATEAKAPPSSPPAPNGSAAPDVDELITTWGLLNEATVAVTARLSAGLEDAGNLGLPEFDVLIRLVREPSRRLPMTRLAAEIGLTSGGFTKLADRMESDRLITRERSVTDRRIIYAVVTDHGDAMTTEALIRHAEDLNRYLLEPLGTNGLRALATLARHLRGPQ